MSFEPQKFFVGVVDFFSILLPGALLAYWGKDWAAAAFLGQERFLLHDIESWGVFVVASYVLGHFVAGAGARLDNLIYDPVRRATDFDHVRRLSVGKRKVLPQVWWPVARAIGIPEDTSDAAVFHVVRLKSRALSALNAANSINAYQWSKAVLSKEHPDGLVQVERFEAVSKFFRSFSVVLFITILMFAYQRNLPAAGAGIVLLLLAVGFYMERRFKGTEQAYWLILALEGLKRASSTSEPGSHRPDGLAYAGAVLRDGSGQPGRHLVVRDHKYADTWSFPRAPIEVGDNPREKVVWLIKGCTGQWARIEDFVGDFPVEESWEPSMARFYSKLEQPLARYYSMRLVDESPADLPAPFADNRVVEWKTVDDLGPALSEESQKVLRTYDPRRS